MLIFSRINSTLLLGCLTDSLPAHLYLQFDVVINAGVAPLLFDDTFPLQDNADFFSFFRADDADPVGSTHITWSIFSQIE